MNKRNDQKNTISVSKAEIGPVEKKSVRIIFSIRVKLVFFLAAVAFTAYANTFRNEYAFDDISVITKNTIVTKGISAIPEILSTPYRWGFYKTSNDLYRPLSEVMFALEYQVFDGAPGPLHFINVLFFAGCVILLFLFLDRIFERKKTSIAFIAALFFALHPIHTEVVANIKGRDELLCFFFAFLSLNVFIKYAENGKPWQLLLGLTCFFLSLLSKETAISFLVVIPLVFFFFINQNKKHSLYIACGSTVAAIIFIAIHFNVLHAYHADNISDVQFIDNALSGAPSIASGLATAILILGKYAKLLLVPYPLICDYSYNSIPFVSFGNPWVLLSFAVYVFLMSFGIYRLLKNNRDPISFGILFYLITIALFSNILFFTGAAMAERFLFFSSAGFCLLLALAIGQLTKLLPGWAPEDLIKRRGLIIVAPIAITYLVLTACRNNEWQNSLTLYRADVKKSPDNARLYYYLGNELLTSGEDQDMSTKQQIAGEAIADLQKAISIYPDYDDAHRVIGNGYYLVSNYDSAVFHFKRAIALNPHDMAAMNNLNVAYFGAQKYRQAIDVCKSMLANDPHFAEGYNDIGLCYMHLAEYDAAVYFLNKGVHTDPAFNSFYENLALAYKLRGSVDSAKKYETIAQKQHPEFRVM